MATETWDGALSALEERAGTESLEHLHAERRKILAANARLIALHGPFGHYDDRRKRMVEAMKINRLARRATEFHVTEIR